jgi:hypothetical protein
MRKWAQLTAVAIMMGFAGSGPALQAAPQNSEQAKPASSPAAPQDSLAEAARKARERRKEESATTRVFTNDNLPTTGGISSVGQAAASPAKGSTAPGSDAKKTGAKDAASSGSAEDMWRDKFAALRRKLQQDQDNLALLQRELGTLNTQFYGDPNKQLQQQLTRSDIDKKTAEIDRATEQVAADQKAIDDAQNDLRTSGGDPGWAR